MMKIKRRKTIVATVILLAISLTGIAAFAMTHRTISDTIPVSAGY